VSYRATGWAYAQDVTPCGAKFVLVALADFADEGHSCYPGQQRLAEMTGQSVDTVARHLKRLVELGYISKEHRQGKGGHRTSDRYWLTVESNPAKCGDGPTLQNPEPNPAETLDPTLQIIGRNHKGTTSRTTSARERARPLPEDWQPSQQQKEYGSALNLDVARELEAFKAHALATDRRQVRWDQAFRLWLVNSSSRRPATRRGPRIVNGREVEYD
jgi:DNA-binding transcriptional MocR family regulator